MQAQACAALGAPFCAALLQRSVENLARSEVLTRLLAPWADARLRTLITKAVPVRLLGAFHHLALNGKAPAVTAAYPRAGRPGCAEAAWAATIAAMEDHERSTAAFMAHEPQTNEVQRSACLAPGFLTIAPRPAVSFGASKSVRAQASIKSGTDIGMNLVRQPEVRSKLRSR